MNLQVKQYKITDSYDYERPDKPEDWAKDWDNLSFDERIALCDKYDVVYIATRVIS